MDEVDENIIQNSFKCCGISTKTDGLEDDCLFDYDKLLGSVNDNDEIENLNDLGNDDKEVYSEENDYEMSGILKMIMVMKLMKKKVKKKVKQEMKMNTKDQLMKKNVVC